MSQEHVNLWKSEVLVVEMAWTFSVSKKINKGPFMAKEGKKITEKKVFGKWL